MPRLMHNRAAPAVRYAPELPLIFRLENDFVQPWLVGFRPPKFATYFKYLDIDLARRQSAQK